MSSTRALFASSSHLPSTLPPPARLPKLVVLDLDGTVWPYFVDEKAGRIEERLKNNGGIEDFVCFPGCKDVLRQLEEWRIPTAIASRTTKPEVAHKLLERLDISCDAKFLHPGSKKFHFGEIHKRTSVAYKDMLFFDDEPRNMDVEELGVTMYLLEGTFEMQDLLNGIKQWSNRKPGIGDKHAGTFDGMWRVYWGRNRFMIETSLYKTGKKTVKVKIYRTKRYSVDEELFERDVKLLESFDGDDRFRDADQIAFKFEDGEYETVQKTTLEKLLDKVCKRHHLESCG